MPQLMDHEKDYPIQLLKPSTRHTLQDVSGTWRSYQMATLSRHVRIMWRACGRHPQIKLHQQKRSRYPLLSVLQAVRVTCLVWQETGLTSR